MQYSYQYFCRNLSISVLNSNLELDKWVKKLIYTISNIMLHVYIQIKLIIVIYCYP